MMSKSCTALFESSPSLRRPFQSKSLASRFHLKFLGRMCCACLCVCLALHAVGRCSCSGAVSGISVEEVTVYVNAPNCRTAKPQVNVASLTTG